MIEIRWNKKHESNELMNIYYHTQIDYIRLLVSKNHLRGAQIGISF